MIDWNSNEYGDAEDYGVDLERDELAGIAVGRTVVCIEDYEEPGSSTRAYEHDEGTVIGIVRATEGGGPFDLPALGERLLVAWDGSDPDTIDPAYVEES